MKLKYGLIPKKSDKEPKELKKSVIKIKQENPPKSNNG